MGGDRGGKREGGGRERGGREGGRGEGGRKVELNDGEREGKKER